MSQSSNDTADDGRGIVELTEDDHYELLAAEQRRLALDILTEQSSSIELRELATAVAERENGRDPGRVESVEYIRTQLHHVHLPKMADLGVIAYDSDTRQIEPPRVLIAV